MKGEVTAVGVDPASESSSVNAVTRSNIGAVGVVASIGVLLGAAALVSALAIKPPAIGWVGFGVVSVVAVGLGAAALLAFPRMRASLQAPFVAPDGERRLLVIADGACNELLVCNAIVDRLDGAVAVHLVVPVRVSRLHYVMDDEAEERRDAEKSMLSSVRLLQERHIPATGSLGGDDPLEAIADALGWFPATEVLARERALTPVAVTQVIVPTGAGGGRLAEAGVAR